MLPSSERTAPGSPQSGPVAQGIASPRRGLPQDVVTALRNGPFEAALDAAIRTSGLSLDRIQHRLAARGVDVSVTTLSYWRRGRSRPERPQSRRAVRMLEELLEVPTDALVALLGPQRPRGRWVNRPTVLAAERLWGEYASLPSLLGEMGSTDDGLVRLAAHDRFELDENGAESSQRTTLVLQAARERVDRCVVITRGDDPARALPSLGELRNARLGRVRTDPSVPLVVAELFLDRVLSAGETEIVEYTCSFPETGSPTHESGRGFRAPARLYTIEVAFHPAAVPVRCHSCVGTAVTGTRPSADPVWISASGRAHHVFQDPAPGFCSLRWEWE